MRLQRVRHNWATEQTSGNIEESWLEGTVDPGGASCVSVSLLQTGGLQTPRRGRTLWWTPKIETKVGRCSPSFLPVGGIAGHEGQTGEEDRQMVGHTIKGWVPPLWAPRCPISHTFPPPAGCHVRSTPGRDLHPWLHPLAPGGEPEQTSMSTRLSPFTSPGRTQTPGSRARSQAPQKARELPAVDST